MTALDDKKVWVVEQEHQALPGIWQLASPPQSLEQCELEKPIYEYWAGTKARIRLYRPAEEKK